MKNKRNVLVMITALVGLVAVGCGSSSKPASTATTTSGGSATTGSGSSAANTASAPGVTPTTIKIGFVTSVTGNASSTFATAGIGAKAYFNAVNKAGGVDGRQLQLVTEDDASAPTGALTAVQSLISQGAFAIISDTPYFFGGYKEAQQAGVPVTGGGFDGPEWGEQPNTNMFSVTGGINPAHAQVLGTVPAAQLFKTVGVSNISGLAYGDSPSSISSINDLKTAVEDQGQKMVYENLALPFGTTDVTATVLSLKNAGTDMAVCSCVQSTVLALVSGLKQAGSTSKSLSFASADSSLFADPSATQAAQGVYYASQTPPFDINNAASTTLQNNIKAVDPSYVIGTYPSYGIITAYLSAALMVEGLQAAGQNPTRQSFITNLSKVASWNANGLLASPVGFNHFGTSDSYLCYFYVHVQGQTFVHVPGGNGANGAFCGNLPSNL